MRITTEILECNLKLNRPYSQDSRVLPRYNGHNPGLYLQHGNRLIRQHG
jgi:hypothetical protein